MAKLADAPDLGSGGKPWGFKSSHPHQEIERTSVRFFRVLFHYFVLFFCCSDYKYLIFLYLKYKIVLCLVGLYGIICFIRVVLWKF